MLHRTRLKEIVYVVAVASVAGTTAAGAASTGAAAVVAAELSAAGSAASLATGTVGLTPLVVTSPDFRPAIASPVPS